LGEEASTKHSKHTKGLYPTPQEMRDASAKIRQAPDQIEDYYKIQKGRLARLRKNLPLVEHSGQKELLDYLRKEGQNMLIRSFDPQSKNTVVVQAAAKVFHDMQKSEDSAFFEIHSRMSEAIPPVDENGHRIDHMSVFASEMYNFGIYFENIGMLDNHELLHTLIISTFCAAMSRDCALLFGMPAAIPHIFLMGVRGTGKSHTIEVLANLLLEGTVNTMNSHSSRAYDSGTTNVSDTATVSDELTADVAPEKAKSPQEVASVHQKKSAMTEGVLTHMYLECNKEGGRETITIRSMVRQLTIILANDREIPQGDDSFYNRLLTHYFFVSNQRSGSRDLTLQSCNMAGGSVSSILQSRSSLRDKWIKFLHAACVFISKGVQLMCFPYPNIIMLYLHFTNVYTKVIRPKVPSITRHNRIAGMMFAEGVMLTIAHAVHITCASEASSILDFNHATQTLKLKPFRMEQLFSANPYLFCSEDIAMFVITKYVYKHMIPAVHYITATALAKIGCGYEKGKTKGPFNPSRQTGVTMDAAVKYAKYKEGNDISVEDPNFLQSRLTLGAICDWFTRVGGQNSYSAKEILMFLSGMEINVRYFDPLNPTAPPEMKRVFAAKIIDPREMGRANSLGHTTGPDPASIVQLSVAYLEDFHPDDITKQIMKAMCYTGTRPRDILLGYTNPAFPFMYQKYTLKKGSKPLDVSDTSFMADSIKEGLCTAYSISLESRDHANMINKITNQKYHFTEDAEKFLHLEWLKAYATLPGNMPPEVFLHKNVSDIVYQRRHELACYRPKPFVYPDDIEKEYASLIKKIKDQEEEAAREAVGIPSSSSDIPHLRDDSEIVQDATLISRLQSGKGILSTNTEITDPELEEIADSLMQEFSFQDEMDAWSHYEMTETLREIEEEAKKKHVQKLIPTSSSSSSSSTKSKRVRFE
jgi:hypothetical protein